MWSFTLCYYHTRCILGDGTESWGAGQASGVHHSDDGGDDKDGDEGGDDNDGDDVDDDNGGDKDDVVMMVVMMMVISVTFVT